MSGGLFPEDNLLAPLDDSFVRLVHQLLADYTREITGYAQDSARAARIVPRMTAYFDLLNWISAEEITSAYDSAIALVVDLFPLSSDGGYWDTWEAVLYFCIKVAEQANPPDERLSTLQYYLARLLHQRGFWDAALDHAGRVVTLLAPDQAVIAAEQPVIYAKTLGIMTDILHNRGELAEVGALLDQAFAIVDPALSVEAYCLLLLQLADYVRRRGQLSAAVAYATEAIDLLHERGITDQQLLALAFKERGVFAWVNGEYRLSISDLIEAKQRYTALGEPYLVSNTHNCLGLVYLNTNLDLAQDNFEESLAIAQNLHAMKAQTQATGNLALTYLLKGELDTALQFVNAHHDLAIRHHFADEQGRATGNRGVILLARRAFAAAEAYLLHGLDRARYLGRYMEEICFAANLSRCYWGMGDRANTHALLEQAQAIAYVHEMSALSVRLTLLRAEALLLSPAAQIRRLEQVLELAQGLRAHDRAAACFALATLSASPPVKARYWLQGCDTLMQVKAAGWLRGVTSESPPLIPYTL